MKKPVTRLLFVISTVLLTTACSQTSASKVDPSEIYTDYSAALTENEGAQFSARFFVGGTTGTYVELDGSSAITLNGNALRKENSLFGEISYGWEDLSLKQETDASLVFRYVDVDGKPLENSFRFPKLARISTASGTVFPKAQPAVIQWQASSALPSGANLTVYLSRGKHHLSGQAQAGAQSTGTVSVALQEYPSLEPGTADLQICHSHSPAIATPQAGGRLSVSICSARVSVQIQ